MDADKLEIPEGLPAWRESGMRCVVQYLINEDAYVARFDTVHEGDQYNIAFKATPEELKDHNQTPEQFGKMLVPLALELWSERFEKNSWAKGRGMNLYRR